MEPGRLARLLATLAAGQGPGAPAARQALIPLARTPGVKSDPELRRLLSLLGLR